MKDGIKFTKIVRIAAFLNLFLFAVASRSAAQNYCIPADTAAGIDLGINTVKTLNAYSNILNASTGFSAGGYIDYVSESVVAYPADSFMLQASAINGNMHWAVWIDWNIDGDFDDSGELVYQDNTNVTPSFSAVIAVPASADTGTGLSKMRVMALRSGNATDPCDTNMDGEVEDYGIVFLGGSSGTGISTAAPQPSVVKLFPNPAKDRVIVQAMAAQSLEAISIMNVLGQRVRQYSPKGRTQVTLNVAELPAGIYQILVQTAKGRTCQRLEIL